MAAANVNEVCRLCPSTVDLLNVFDTTISFKYDIREVVLVNTGIEVLPTDVVSKKICRRCCNILYKTYEFRLDACRQDKKLKEKCGQDLGDSGRPLPNTYSTLKKETTDLINKIMKTEPGQEPSSSRTADNLQRIHPSVANVFRNYPLFKLPKKCLERNIAPVVSLTMGEVETYFKKRKLNMKKFTYKPSTKTSVSRNVAKKKTTIPAKEKTVAPLKISRKLLENREALEINNDTGYVRLSVPKEAKGRKRKISSSSDKSVQLKLSRNNQPQSLSVPGSNTNSPKTIVNNAVKALEAVSSSSSDFPETLKLHNPSNDIPGTSKQQIRTPSPAPIDPLSGVSTTPRQGSTDPLENSRTPSPASADPLSEDSRDSCSTDISAATSSSTNKPQFMESFGLTPTVTTTKSHTLLVCSLCGSIHHNAYELKKHTTKHMVCQFCKLKFKSVESKQKHVDRTCLVKKVMVSPLPTVNLEKIHLNVNVRKKYRSAFTSFALIPGVQEEPTPVEKVILKAASPLPLVAKDAVIVLSDDEDEAPARSADPLSGIPTTSASPPPAMEELVYNTVSIVRPDIRFRNNMILNDLVENMTDKHLIKDLIELFKPKRVQTAEIMLQTDLPASKDIKIHNSEGTCEFTSLKGQLSTYKVPVTISNGQFHVSYQFRDNSNTNNSMALWDGLPIIDVCKKAASKLPGQSKNVLKHSNTNGITSSLPKTSKAPLLGQVVISSTLAMQNGTIPFSLPSSTIIQAVPVGTTSNTGLVAVQRATPISSTINIISNSVSNSATPLLQNYALSMTSAPVISNPIPIPRTYINSALNNTISNSNRTVSKPTSSVTISHNRSLPSSFVMDRSAITPCPPNTSLSAVHQNSQPSSSHLTNTTFAPTTTTITPLSKTSNNHLASLSDKSSSYIPPAQEIPKFRVKNVWELQ